MPYSISASRTPLGTESTPTSFAPSDLPSTLYSLVARLRLDLYVVFAHAYSEMQLLTLLRIDCMVLYPCRKKFRMLALTSFMFTEQF